MFRLPPSGRPAFASFLLLVVGGFFLSGAFCFLFFPVLISVQESGSSDVASMLLATLPFGLAFLAIGVFMASFALRPFFVSRYVDDPEVTISDATPGLGDTVSVSILQSFRRSITVRQSRLQLIFREKVEYFNGKTTSTETRDTVIAEYALPGGEFAPGQPMDTACSVQLPRDGMHSFSAAHNWIEWFLRFQLDIPGRMDFRREYPISVRAKIL